MYVTERQISHKQSISAGKMYSTIYLEWSGDHLGLGLMQSNPLLMKVCMTCDLKTSLLSSSTIFPINYKCLQPSVFPISRKSEAWEGEMGGLQHLTQPLGRVA